MQLWDQLMSDNRPISSVIGGNNHNSFNQLFNKYNSQIGNSLTRLKEQPQPIEGRDAEIDMLYAVLERPKTPVALLLGQAGVGKTALVEEFGKQLNSGSYNTELDYKYLLLSLRVGSLGSIGNDKLQSELANMLDNLKYFEDVAQRMLNDPNIRLVLFIDEVHMLVTIFGSGTKIGGDVIKDVLARSPIRVIAATTRREYDSTIVVDKPLSERFKQIEMHELAPDIVVKICKSWWSKIAPDCPIPSDSIIRRVIDANAAYRSDSAEPRKSLDILEDFVSYCRRTGLPVSNDVVDQIFKNRYSINLSFNIDADAVYKNIEKQVIGQYHALYVWKRLLRSTVYNSRSGNTTNKPIFTTLLTGSTGSGKTQSVKAICESLYPDQPVLLNINMPDYKTPEHEDAFRKRVGEFVRHTPNAVILLDEFEKAHETIRDALLTILDEGLITFSVINREGAPEVNTISLRNTIVIATTNAGHEIFKNDAKYSQRSAGMDEKVISSQSKAEIDQLMKDLIPFLQNSGFKPEMLGRFSRIIPYRGLSTETLVMIAEREIEKVINKFKIENNIDIEIKEKFQWPQDYDNLVATEIAIYIAFTKANAHDPNSGGARAIMREVQQNLTDTIIDAIIDNPDSKKFRVSVSKKTNIYSGGGTSASEGGIEVHALD